MEKGFQSKETRKGIFLKYTILVILWNINWALIEYFHSLVFQNIVSLVIVPFLALISYLTSEVLRLQKLTYE